MKSTLNTIAAFLLLSMVPTVAHSGQDLDRVMKDGTLKVATDPDWAPQSFLNHDNKMDGFDVDVALEIGRRLGVVVEFVTPSWDAITAGNWNDKWDVSVGSMTPTRQRAKVLEFPAVYYYTPASVAVHKDSATNDVTDLNGKTLGACNDCTSEKYLHHDLTIDAVGVPSFEYQITPGEIKLYPDSASALSELIQGDGVHVDGIIDSMPTILEAMKKNLPIVIVGKPVYYEPLAIAIDRGDQEFSDQLATIVNEMRIDGTLTKFSRKWYNADYTVAW